jgi:hypothetical protein
MDIYQHVLAGNQHMQAATRHAQHRHSQVVGSRHLGPPDGSPAPAASSSAAALPVAQHHWQHQATASLRPPAALLSGCAAAAAAAAAAANIQCCRCFLLWCVAPASQRGVSSAAACCDWHAHVEHDAPQRPVTHLLYHPQQEEAARDKHA